MLCAGDTQGDIMTHRPGGGGGTSVCDAGVRVWSIVQALTRRGGQQRSQVGQQHDSQMLWAGHRCKAADDDLRQGYTVELLETASLVQAAAAAVAMAAAVAAGLGMTAIA